MRWSAFMIGHPFRGVTGPAEGAIHLDSGTSPSPWHQNDFRCRDSPDVHCLTRRRGRHPEGLRQRITIVSYWTKYLSILALSFALTAAAFAHDFKVYPGAVPDQQTANRLMKVASGGNFHIDFYTTTDPFDKVVAFYRTMYKEARPAASPIQPLRLTSYLGVSTGTQEAWFVLDGASDLATSKSWITVSHPWTMRETAGLVGKWYYFTIKKVTVIEWIQNRS